MIANNEPQATETFFGAAVLQNCWIKKLLFCLRHLIHNTF